MENSSEPAAPAQAPRRGEQRQARNAGAGRRPSMISPTPIGGNRTILPHRTRWTARAILIPPPAAPLACRSQRHHRRDPDAAAPPAASSRWSQVPPTERLPDGIGGPVLRAAALKGDPAAAYEIGVRFAEGKGIAPNLDEAAKWYDRAAQAGVVPAVFRLGTFYEKGLSVKKDVDIARRYYAAGGRARQRQGDA